MKNLKAEANAFDKIISQRVKKGINYDLKSNKVNHFFINNPWRYHDTRKIAFLDKIKFIKNNISSKSLILDVGCGCGSLSFELVRSGHKVTGIDISKKSILIAKKIANKNLTFIQKKNLILENKSFEKISMEKKKFDVVIFFKTLHHLKFTKRVIYNTNSILKKNGRVIIIEPLRDDINKINIAFGLLTRILATTWEKTNTKIKKYKNINDSFNKLFKEYTYTKTSKGYDQSPNDNSISSSEEVINNVKKFFKITKIKNKDVFKDKIIGGIRGEARSDFVRLISKFDDLLISQKIAKGSTLMLVAKKLRKN